MSEPTTDSSESSDLAMSKGYMLDRANARKSLSSNSNIISDGESSQDMTSDGDYHYDEDIDDERPHYDDDAENDPKYEVDFEYSLYDSSDKNNIIEDVVLAFDGIYVSDVPDGLFYEDNPKAEVNPKLENIYEPFDRTYNLNKATTPWYVASLDGTDEDIITPRKTDKILKSHTPISPRGHYFTDSSNIDSFYGEESDISMDSLYFTENPMARHSDSIEEDVDEQVLAVLTDIVCIIDERSLMSMEDSPVQPFTEIEASSGDNESANGLPVIITLPAISYPDDSDDDGTLVALSPRSRNNIQASPSRYQRHGMNTITIHTTEEYIEYSLPFQDPIATANELANIRSINNNYSSFSSIPGATYHRRISTKSTVITSYDPPGFLRKILHLYIMAHLYIIMFVVQHAQPVKTAQRVASASVYLISLPLKMNAWIAKAYWQLFISGSILILSHAPGGRRILNFMNYDKDALLLQ